MENYLIDPRLKEGKDYPIELSSLIEAFKGGRFMVLKGKGAELTKKKENKEVRIIEKMFIDYFLYQARMLKFEKYNLTITKDNISEWPLDKIKAHRKELNKVWKEEFGTEKPNLTVEKIIKKVNAKLKIANPGLMRKGAGPGFYLEPIILY